MPQGQNAVPDDLPPHGWYRVSIT